MSRYRSELLAGGIVVEGPDEDEAYERDRQRKDDLLEQQRRAARVSVETLPPTLPKRIACHACDHLYAGAKCPACHQWRPAYLALKNISRRTA